jgi:branched-subunit amino acid ABC-type transport system permease component
VAALAATMLAPIFLVNPWMGIPPQLKAFIVVVLGGLGRVGELWGSHSWGVFTGVHRKPGHCLSFLGVERCGGLWSSHLFLSF